MHEQLPPPPGFIASELGSVSPTRPYFRVIPVPLEHSVSYGSGTADGPRAILEASQQLEAFDGASLPIELGIATADFVDCSGSVEEVIGRVHQATSKALADGVVPVLLGGEHTITYGALEAVHQWTERPIGVFQLDAHADLRDSYEGSGFSHACVARRIHADLKMPIFQFGVRALCQEESIYRSASDISFVDARDFYRHGIDAVTLPNTFPKDIYLTLDVDGLDPSVIRATGTPVPGGPGWYDTLAVLEKVISGRRVVGFDVVELAPVEHDHASSFAAAQLVYTVMGIIQRCSFRQQTNRLSG